MNLMDEADTRISFSETKEQEKGVWFLWLYFKERADWFHWKGCHNRKIVTVSDEKGLPEGCRRSKRARWSSSMTFVNSLKFELGFSAKPRNREE